jgi:hypothetical protein
MQHPLYLKKHLTNQKFHEVKNQSNEKKKLKKIKPESMVKIV